MTHLAAVLGKTSLLVLLNQMGVEKEITGAIAMES